MSTSMRAVSSLTLDPGDYAIEPAAWRRDAGQQLSNLTGGSGESDEPIWHLHDIVRADGTPVMEVYEDRRGMEGRLQTAGRQFLFRSPEGDSLMAYEREGYTVGGTSTLEDRTADEPLGSWETTGLRGRLLRGRWKLSDPDGTHRATATRNWSLGAFLYPTFTLDSADGSDIGRASVRRDGMFYRMDVTLDRSAVPTEVVLAMTYGILWAFSHG